MPYFLRHTRGMHISEMQANEQFLLDSLVFSGACKFLLKVLQRSRKGAWMDFDRNILQIKLKSLSL